MKALPARLSQRGGNLLAKSLVIVTGGCGYIGSHTLIDLLNRDFDVVSIDNFCRSRPYALQGIETITGTRIVNHSVDLCDRMAVREVFSRYAHAIGVIHFAAFKSVPESIGHPSMYYHNNLVSLINVLESVQAHSIRHFVFSSSCSVYGDINRLPVTEETTLSRANSAYAYTKVVGERITEEMTRSAGINAVVLRYFNPVGAHLSGILGELPLQRPDNLVPLITQTAAGRVAQLTVFGGVLPTRDGSCVRDYVHVMDVARAHSMALRYMMQREGVHEIINLGMGIGVSVLETIQAFEKVSGHTLNYRVGLPREGDVVEIYSDPSKARKLLGWEAEYSIYTMMSTAWKWQLFLEQNKID